MINVKVVAIVAVSFLAFVAMIIIGGTIANQRATNPVVCPHGLHPVTQTYNPHGGSATGVLVTTCQPN